MLGLPFQLSGVRYSVLVANRLRNVLSNPAISRCLRGGFEIKTRHVARGDERVRLMMTAQEDYCGVDLVATIGDLRKGSFSAIAEMIVSSACHDFRFCRASALGCETIKAPASVMNPSPTISQCLDDVGVLWSMTGLCLSS
jgi:hypothetical protein